MLRIILKLSVALWLFFAFCFAAGQEAVTVPEAGKDFSAASGEHDWHNQPPTFQLTPASPEARTGKIWVRKTAQGLLVAGHVDGPAPVFPTTADTLMTKDHVEIWLAQQPSPDFPVLGWGNQFGDQELPEGEESCAEFVKDKDPGSVEECRAWVKKQRAYRVQLKRLFARQWQLAPQIGVESFANPAYRVITAGEMKDKDSSPSNVTPLKPDGVPALKVKLQAGGGYDFETLIPWKLFPPVADSTLQDLYLMVEVFSPAAAGRKSGPYSTTAPGRGYADFTNFSRIRFEQPREFTVTPCHYPLVGHGFLDDAVKGYFMPADDDMISQVFVLENYRGGYAYDPTGNSPEVGRTSFFWKKLGDNEYVCGPLLRLYSSGKATDIKLGKGKKPYQIEVEKDSFDVFPLPGGSMLLRNGPHVIYSKFGSGQCGACPRPELRIYTLDANLNVSDGLDIFELVGNELDDVDIQMSKDWNRVGVYRHHLDAAEAVWEDEFYCRQGAKYEQCGTATMAPPEPRTLAPNENPN